MTASAPGLFALKNAEITRSAFRRSSCRVRMCACELFREPFQGKPRHPAEIDNAPDHAARAGDNPGRFQAVQRLEEGRAGKPGCSLPGAHNARTLSLGRHQGQSAPVVRHGIFDATMRCVIGCRSSS